MQVHILAVGRLRPGPEHALVSDYLTRAQKAGRGLGFSGFDVIEVEERKGGGMAAEAALIRKSLPKGSIFVALDERGQKLSSPDLADRVATWRDDGQRAATFVIGGADGLDPSLRADADYSLSLGPMVWPHMLVRVMVAEQLYRSVSILAGSPYHRA
ncbi:MAG: 23S rRNA (pseudouridine(1915)-N(3))-methyltransferase RlmH [Pseudomonadota bacterium]